MANMLLTTDILAKEMSLLLFEQLGQRTIGERAEKQISIEIALTSGDLAQTINEFSESKLAPIAAALATKIPPGAKIVPLPAPVTANSSTRILNGVSVRVLRTMDVSSKNMIYRFDIGYQ